MNEITFVARGGS